MSLKGLSPMIIGHRGAAGEAPENTLASFALALEQGAGGIELDVHITKDGQIAVCHDATLDRTTDGKGSISELTADEIRRFDAGGWFSDAYRGEKVPLLGEVFELIPAGIMINVEVKDSYEGRMEKALLDFLRQSGRLNDVVISSFDHKCIKRIKQAEPEVKAGLLYTANLADHAAYAQLLGVEIYSLHPHYHYIGSEDVQRAAAEELQVYPYTVNREEELRRMIEYGVSGIITDYPARLKELLK